MHTRKQTPRTPTPTKTTVTARASPRPKRRSRRSRRRLAGGAAIANGATGCVFDPAINCKHQPPESKGKISKLSLAENSVAEWAKLAIIKNAIQVDTNLDKYFILADKEPCEPDFTDEELKGYHGFCRFAKQSTLSILQSINGGPTLLNLSTTRQLLFIPFLNAMIELLRGGIVPLNNQGILHRDIKPDNVVCSSTSGKYEIRLIDWDRAAKLDTASITEISKREEFFSSMSNQPIAYAFISAAATAQTTASNTANLSMLLKNVSTRTHILYEDNAATYATGTKDVTKKVLPQITAIVNKFYNSTKSFNWNEYAKLLTRNYDVYGWLSVINLCMQKQGTMFSDATSYEYYVEPMKAFLRHYMYTPEVLAEPYDTAAMIKRLNKIRKSPLKTTALPPC